MNKESQRPYFCFRLFVDGAQYVIHLCKLSKAREGHEHSTSVLLRRNADVTVVDDSGRTPVDLAQNKWIQTVLRQAWNDATCRKLDTEIVAATNPAAAGNELSHMTVTESSEQSKSSTANPPSVRPAGKLSRPFRQSRSLDQPETNCSPSSPFTRVSMSYNFKFILIPPLYVLCVFFVK